MIEYINKYITTDDNSDDVDCILNYKFDKTIMMEYINKSILKKKYKHNISCEISQCCFYNRNKQWFLGINLGNFNGDRSDEIDISIFDVNKYNSDLQKMFVDFKLIKYCNNIPKLYPIANGCFFCT